MGSEGYLINEFTAEATNDRDDEFGGSFERRGRFPAEIVKAVRARAGSDFLLIYRISSIDLVDGGLTGTEVAELARRVEAAGAHVINTGIGSHESGGADHCGQRAPGRLELRGGRCQGGGVDPGHRVQPGSTTRRSPRTLLARGVADTVSLARPLLADPDFAAKVLNRAKPRRSRPASRQPGVGLANPRPPSWNSDSDLHGQPAGRAGDRIHHSRSPFGGRQADRSRRRGPGLARLRRQRRRARSSGHAVRGGRPHRRSAQHGADRARQGRVQPAAAVLPRPPGTTRRRGQAGHAGRRGRPGGGGLRRGGPSHRRRPAHARDPGGPTTRW